MHRTKAYRKRFGFYPESVYADGIYGTRDNRKWLKNHGIRFAGKPLGRPKKATADNKEEISQAKQQRREDERNRIPVEGKFGQGKNGYRLNQIRARLASTSEAWIRSIFLVMNLVALLRFLLSTLKMTTFYAVSDSVKTYMHCIRAILRRLNPFPMPSAVYRIRDKRGFLRRL